MQYLIYQGESCIPVEATTVKREALAIARRLKAASPADRVIVERGDGLVIRRFPAQP